MDNNADIIYNLPINQSQPSHNELKMVDTFFQNSNNSSFVTELKDIMLICILFIVFSLPQVIKLINNIPFPKNSPYILLIVQALIFGMTYWLIKNFWLARK